MVDDRLWHNASFRCGAKLWTRSDQSGHAEGVEPTRMTRSGHEPAAFAAMRGRDLLYFHDASVWGERDEAARLHGTARRCGGMAARSARATASDAGDRVPECLGAQ
jgi:hypothetical protein